MSLLVLSLCIDLGEERKPDVLHQDRKELRPGVGVELDPGDHALKHLLLGWHSDGVRADQLGNLGILNHATV